MWKRFLTERGWVKLPWGPTYGFGICGSKASNFGAGIQFWFISNAMVWHYKNFASPRASHPFFFLEIGCILCADVYSRNTHLEHFGTTSRDIPAKNINTKQSYTENTAINQMLACQKKMWGHTLQHLFKNGCIAGKKDISLAPALHNWSWFKGTIHFHPAGWLTIFPDLNPIRASGSQVYNRMLQQGDLARGSLGYGQHRSLAQVVGSDYEAEDWTWSHDV